MLTKYLTFKKIGAANFQSLKLFQNFKKEKKKKELHLCTSNYQIAQQHGQTQT